MLLNVIQKYLKSILVLLLILFLSFSSPSNFKKLPDLNLFNNFDKLVHFLLFGSLTFILLWESKKDIRIKSNPKILFYLCFLFPVLFGGLVELMQQFFFAPRSAEWIDWAANISGTITVWILLIIIQKRKSVSL